MQITDPIADMLTRIRNAGSAGHESCVIPASNMKKSIANILLDEGYIEKIDYTDKGVQGEIIVTLKYRDSKNVIKGIKRISKPGLRVYANAQEMPKVLGGLGIAIVSTSKGVMSDKQARKENVGGEVLAYVW
ncbi:MAG: 30S ribosomal protein S8 [Eubacteriales bacterium]|nr:30S ribosomal protein S8 [Eubacteriales bacterium]